MKAIQTAAVAPVNWKASQILGIKFAAKKMTNNKAAVIPANRLLSPDNGRPEGNTSPSKLSLSA